MSRRTLTTLWIITGLVALALLAATIGLARRASTQAVVNSTVYLTSGSVSVGLHEQPNQESPVIAVLVRDSAVTVMAIANEGGRTWYYVQKGTMTPGWVSAENIRLHAP